MNADMRLPPIASVHCCHLSNPYQFNLPISHILSLCASEFFGEGGGELITKRTGLRWRCFGHCREQHIRES